MLFQSTNMIYVPLTLVYTCMLEVTINTQVGTTFISTVISNEWVKSHRCYHVSSIHTVTKFCLKFTFYSGHTLLLALTSAPLSTRVVTTSTCPLRAAIMRGVHKSCVQQKEDHIMIQSKNLVTDRTCRINFFLGKSKS